MKIALDSFVAVPLPHDLYAQFAQRYRGGVSGVMEHVLQDFLERTADDFAPEAAHRAGVQWDALLLPHGTQVRTKYYGEYAIAEVVDGKILWDGAEYPTMSQLARAMRGDTSNNAWVVLEIKRPSDSNWRLADRLRG
jgi:hypothetical protein